MKVALLVLLLPIAALAGDNSWLRVSTSHFEVLSDAGEKTAREAILRFEQIRRVLGPSRESPLPVRVFVFDSEKDFAPYRPSPTTRGFYQSGPDRDYIAMSEAGSETYRVVYHEYMHLVLNHSSAKLPLWLEEGTAEFYSTLESTGDKLRIGRPVTQHVQALTARPWLKATDLASLHKDSPLYQEGLRAGILYAQSWALVHMMNTSPTYRNQLPRFAELLAEAVSPQDAFPRAFSKSLDEAMRDLENIVRARRFPVIEIAWDDDEAPPITIDKVPPDEIAVARAELFNAIGRADQALPIYQSLLNRSPNSATLQHGLGQILLSRRDYTGARQHLEKAIALGSREADVHFEYAMLLRETGAPSDTVRAQLLKTIDLNPQYAEALFLLGNESLTAGRLDESISYLQRAVKVLPRQPSFWHALTYAYHRSGFKELAERAARRTRDAAESPQEQEMATAALRLVSQRPPSPSSPKPSVTTPQRWFNRQGDATAEGRLVEVKCSPSPARFHVVPASGPALQLEVLNPNEVVLLNNSSQPIRDLPCGKLENIPVKVHYLSTTKELLSVEFH